MDEDFRSYFRERVANYEQYGGSPPAFWSKEQDPVVDNAVRAAVNAGREEADRRGLDLRDDAQLLILLLAREVVARPVVEISPEDAESLPDDLANDVATVVKRVADESTDREVSIHTFLDGLSASWEELRSGRYRLWDRHRGRGSEGSHRAEPVS
jgi:hypothetical protein